MAAVACRHCPHARIAPSRQHSKNIERKTAPRRNKTALYRGDSFRIQSAGLEALTRAYSVDVLIGPTAADLVRDEFHLRSVARVQVKGKTLPVDVFTLIGARSDTSNAELLKWLESYEEGIAKFRERDFTAAKIMFSRFLEFYPEDFLAKMYLERALEYEQQPPDEAWNAVEVFKKK